MSIPPATPEWPRAAAETCSQGLIGGLLARGYRALDAALLGVWIHGFAGDRLSEECTPEAYSSLDLIEALYKGFKVLLG